MINNKEFKLKLIKYKNLVDNFSYLSSLQLINKILPIVVYPYLIRVLGKENYGLVVFAQAVVTYLVVLVSFGFNFSATKEVSVNRDDSDKLSTIISSTLIIKACLFLISFLILSVILYFLPQTHGFKLLFYLTLWMCFYDLIFPVWYFQGIEKMKYITILTLISRLLFLGLIFVFIRKPEDYLFVPIINGIGALIVGILSLIIIFGKHKIKFKVQTFITLKEYFLDSAPIFISNLSTTLYVSTNKVILGLFSGMNEVAYYDLAEKLTTVLKTPIFIIGQSIFPKIAKDRDQRFVKKVFVYTLLLVFVIFIVGLVSSNFLIRIIGGIEMMFSVSVFRILLISIIPVAISLFFANLTLLPWGFNKDYMKMRLYNNIIYFIGLTTLYFFDKISLISLASLATGIETCTAALAVFYCNKRKVNFIW